MIYCDPVTHRKTKTPVIQAVNFLPWRRTNPWRVGNTHGWAWLPQMYLNTDWSDPTGDDSYGLWRDFFGALESAGATKVAIGYAGPFADQYHTEHVWNAVRFCIPEARGRKRRSDRYAALRAIAQYHPDVLGPVSCDCYVAWWNT